MAGTPGRRVNAPTDGAVRWLAVAALALGVLAAAAGSPYVARHATVDVEQLGRAVAREDDHVTAVELAEWIKARQPGLRVVDVRGAREFDEYHIPTAERVAVDSIASVPFKSTDTIVLYSEGGAHAAQAWVFLRALGYRRVYFLRGGLYEWIEQVMNPTVAEGTSDSARAAFARAAVVSRYFGGVPRQAGERRHDDAIPLPRARSDSGRAAATTAAAVGLVRRRGC